jgi:hypothetical protein
MRRLLLPPLLPLLLQVAANWIELATLGWGPVAILAAMNGGQRGIRKSFGKTMRFGRARGVLVRVRHPPPREPLARHSRAPALLATFRHPIRMRSIGQEPRRIPVQSAWASRAAADSFLILPPVALLAVRHGPRNATIKARTDATSRGRLLTTQHLHLLLRRQLLLMLLLMLLPLLLLLLLLLLLMPSLNMADRFIFPAAG